MGSLTENDPGLNPRCHRLVIHLLKRIDSIQYVRNELPVRENSWNCCSRRLQLTANMKPRSMSGNRYSRG